MNALYYRIGLKTKLAALAALAMIAVLIPVHELWTESSGNLEQAQAELSGVAPLSAAIEAVSASRSLRLASVRALEGSDPRSSQDQARQKAEQAMADLSRSVADQHLDAVVPGVAERKALFDRYVQTVTAPGATPDQAAFDGMALADGLMATITDVCNAATISLDPEAETYYQFDLVANRLTPFIENVGRMRAFAAMAQRRGADPTLLARLDQQRRTVLGLRAALMASLRQVAASQSDPEAAKVFADAGAKIDQAAGLALSDAEAFAGQVGHASDKGHITGGSPAAADALFTHINETVVISSDTMQRAVALFSTRLQKRVETLQGRRTTMVGLVLALAAALAALLCAFTFSMLVPVKRLLGKADRIAGGDLSRDSSAIRGNNEMARLMHGLEAMRAALETRITAEREAAEINQRIRTALDSVSVSVMVADADNRISYCNPAVTRLLAEVEPEMRNIMPGFSASQLVGRSIDEFHRNPAHQQGMLRTLAGSHSADISLGKMRMRLVVNPIVGTDGTRLGSVVQWLDRTAEIAAEQEIAAVIAAAAAGDFSLRIAAEGKAGFFKVVADHVNALVGTASEGLSEVELALQKLAQGDLTHRIDKPMAGVFGALRDSANTTAAALTQLVTEIRDATSAIASAAKEIAQGNQNLSSRTEEQAASLQETAASMEELTSTVKQNSDNALEADTLAGRAAETAFNGGQAVQEVVQTMAQIHESARKVADIIGVIDGIAFQTNILALNAAVEAARAGEQGRGFAVVASEVRGLAQRSATAAKEIKGLIGESVERVAVGSRQVERAGATMTELVGAVQSVSTLVRQISGASTEQSTGISQVNTAVTQMDEGTQQNAALVEQAAAAAESMAEQAQRLSTSVGVFRIDARAIAEPAPARTSAAAPGTAAGSALRQASASSAHSRPVRATTPVRPATGKPGATTARPAAATAVPQRGAAALPKAAARPTSSGTAARATAAGTEAIRGLDAAPLEDEWEEF